MCTDITDYCGQVCGGGYCGTEYVCSNGIDPNTRMPPTPEVLVKQEALNRRKQGADDPNCPF